MRWFLYLEILVRDRLCPYLVRRTFSLDRRIIATIAATRRIWIDFLLSASELVVRVLGDYRRDVEYPTIAIPACV